MSKVLIYSQEDLDLILELEKEKNEELQQENKKLNGAIQTYDILLKANVEESKQLKDNWIKLKEFIKECLEAIDTIQKLTGNAIENYTPRILTYKQIKNKMQELEQGSDK